MRTLLILLITSISISLEAQNKKPVDYTEAIRLIDLWLDGQRELKEIPGLTVAIVDDQRLVWSKAYGVADIEKNVPATTSTIFSICSISKLFTSIAIMKLWEEGKLRLDDSITAILPSFNLRQQYATSGPITVRSLLTHSSGLPRESNQSYWSAPDFTFPSSKEVNDGLKDQQTLYPASTYYQYSNLGLTLLGQIVEKVSGQPFETYVEENILKPLRMTDTRTTMPKELWGNKLATGYSAVYRDGSRKKLPFFNAGGITAAAGFSSTVEDLARFMSWQFRLQNNNNREILRPSTLKEMQRVQWLDPDWKGSRGLGFGISQIAGSTYTGHGGSCPGYATATVTLPSEKLGVTVMINGQGVGGYDYSIPILQLLKKAKSGEPSADSLKLNDYTGLYDGYAWYGEGIVVPWKGKLALFFNPSDNPSDEMELWKPVGKDIFRRIRSDDSLGEEMKFERDATGKVIRMWRHGNFTNKFR